QHLVLRRPLWLRFPRGWIAVRSRSGRAARRRAPALDCRKRIRSNSSSPHAAAPGACRMNAIYTGHVAHMRHGKHRLRYSVFMLTLDLDRPIRGLRLLRHNRGALFAFFDRDHAERRDAPLKPQIEAKLRDAGIPWDGGRIVLLTMPRLFNYVFNPLSVYFCYRRDGSLAALAHEVSNTFGESHFYILPPR